MNIKKKLEDIQKKPEYIRKRYVFLCVFTSMIFVSVIWVISLEKNLQNMKITEKVDDAVQGIPFNDAMKEFEDQRRLLNENLERESEQLPEGLEFPKETEDNSKSVSE